MYSSLKTTILFYILIHSSLSTAGGPLILEGPGGNTPVTYQDPDITINIESGDLGSLSNIEADMLVTEAFDLWNKVNTSTINLLIDQTQLNIDIDKDNFTSYLPKDAEFHNDDGLNPFVYDANGEIIDELFGINASEDIVGVAASIFLDDGLYFSEGFAVISGKKTLTESDYKILITHEIGHFFGIDHSQVNINNQETTFGLPQICTTSSPQEYPIMYPFICREAASLHPDDISAVSALYPAADINNTMGIIQGTFVTETGSALLGANIWAENLTTGNTYSIVSDYLKQRTGFYKLFLPAGSYTLHANSINAGFSGGSGVGPYATTPFDISFISPHPIDPVTFQGTNEGSAEVITVAASQTLVINFSAIGLTNNISPASDENDSIGDLFGATSYLTILTLLGLLIGRRLIIRQ
jgi:hypothetical protein